MATRVNCCFVFFLLGLNTKYEDEAGATDFYSLLVACNP